MTASRVLEVARSQLGTAETPVNRQPYGRAYGWDGVAWCMQFAWYVLTQAGCAALVPKTASTVVARDWYMKRGQWHTSGPQPGDLAFFKFAGNSNPVNHVGIVESVERGGTIVTIEGNAQPLTARILTPSGWVAMGDIKIGDAVVDPEGNASEVTGIYPQGVKDIYRVTAADGSSTEATADHLWQVEDIGYRRTTRVVTTEWLAERIRRRGPRNVSYGKYRLPSLTPSDLTCAEADNLPLDPWLLGVLLGDGGLGSEDVKLTSVDPETIAGVQDVLPYGVSLKPITLRGEVVRGNWRVISTLRDNRGCQHNPVLRAVRSLGLDGKRSWEKSIPPRYLWNTAKVRMAVLQGLMDTDGSVDPEGRMEYCSVSRQLAEDVQFLIRSLGGKSRLCVKRNVKYTAPNQIEPKAARDAYVLRNIRFADQATVPFRLPRKAERVRERGWLRGWNIASIELVGQAEARCISVSAPSRLYVTDDWIPTHNTAGTNTGDQRNGGMVARKRRLANIVGYARPAYAAPKPTPLAPPKPHIREDEHVLIKSQPDKSKPVYVAGLLTGFNFVGLGPTETPSDKQAADMGLPVLWVEYGTYQEFDRRSHVMLGDQDQ